MTRCSSGAAKPALSAQKKRNSTQWPGEKPKGLKGTLALLFLVRVLFGGVVWDFVFI
jgi:hypothetical protein